MLERFERVADAEFGSSLGEGRTDGYRGSHDFALLADAGERSAPSAGSIWQSHSAREFRLLPCRFVI